MGLVELKAAQKKRLKQIDVSYRADLALAQAKFNRVYDAMLAKYGLTIKTLMDHHSFPIEFHEDEEMVAAKAAYQTDLAVAQQRKQSGASALPRNRLVLRAN